MFIELIDLLRCTKPHEDTWLVASFQTVLNRFVGEGTLGCPVCKAEYPIAHGEADFTGGTTAPSCEEQRAQANRDREQLATRAGAFLDVTEPGATVVLGGVWAHAAQELSQMSRSRILTLNPSSDIRESETVGLLRVASDIPVAPNSVLGVALDSWFPVSIVDSALRAVRPGGRIVGPAEIQPPEALAVLAHDERYWVGQKSPAVVQLSKSRR